MARKRPGDPGYLDEVNHNLNVVLAISCGIVVVLGLMVLPFII